MELLKTTTGKVGDCMQCSNFFLLLRPSTSELLISLSCNHSCFIAVMHFFMSSASNP